jgi:hypothetical protein
VKTTGGEQATPERGDEIDARAAQGFVNKPSGPIEQTFGTKYDVAGNVTIINMGDAQGKESPAPPGGELTFSEIVERGLRAQEKADVIFQDTPDETDAYLPAFEEARKWFAHAHDLRSDDMRVLLHLAQVQFRLTPQETAQVKAWLRDIESALAKSQNVDDTRIRADAYLLHATLTEPPNEQLLKRAYDLYRQLSDQAMLDKIEAMDPGLEHPQPGAPEESKGEPQLSPARQVPVLQVASSTFNPVGRWNVQVQDMVGSRLFVDFGQDGTFQMTQQVGMYQVPVSGTWTFNPVSQQLALQGVVNTFQPFILAITITGQPPNGFTAVGNDGIGYLLTRA